ncbi:hypothetical protein Bca52824_090600 [Brassica carinata]|uniref:Uncharacterized protein n=1 Tax=Brassica carinata TaxID=52824 RepID=A0A8X7THP4_BRACI|nr:hypothetical protein Bca52824_090600 [Brassica carinata]
MDPLQPENDHLPPLISDRVLINGVVTPLTLTAEGELQWTTESGRGKSTTEKEILSFAVVGNKVRVKTLVENGSSICCGGSGGDYEE